MIEILDIKVTKINKRWHARLIQIENDHIIDEMACSNPEDIGFICGEMLRWADKLGWNSPMAHASRHRESKRHHSVGKVWYRDSIHKDKGKATS